MDPFLRPGSAPFSSHTNHIFWTSLFSPIVFAISVTSITGWNGRHVITRCHHSVFHSSWPINSARNFFIIFESGTFGRYLTDSNLTNRFPAFILSSIYKVTYFDLNQITSDLKWPRWAEKFASSIKISNWIYVIL